MDVHVVADDPVRDAVAAALGDVDVGIRDAEPRAVRGADVGVVAAVTGADRLSRANAAAIEGDTPWIAVEVGGVGGVGLSSVEAAVAGFGPGTGCYACLRSRVASTTDEEDRVPDPAADRSAVRLAGAVAGRELVRLLGGDEPSILGTVRELPSARRRLLPVPTCSCQSDDRDRAVVPEETDDPLDLEAAADAADLAIDDRVGPVTEIGEVESFPAPYYLATVADTTAFAENRAAERAAGVDADWTAAFVKAVGEAIERYCAGVYTAAEFHEAPASVLENAIRPDEFVRPDDAPAVGGDEPIPWVDGTNLATGEEVVLPADAVQFPQPGRGVVPAITTGLGLGTTLADAVRSGLTEVIERDATMLAWYSTFEPLELAVGDAAFESLARRARGEDLTVTPLLVTQDVDLPVVTVAVHREGEWPSFAVGSAAALQPTAGARSALAEALQNWMELRSIGPEDADDESGWIGRYATFPEPAREFVSTARRAPAADVGPADPPSGLQAVEWLVERVEEAGLTPYASRLTTPDVESIGFEAVRVLVPGGQPLFTDDPLFGERARTVPRSLGYRPRLDREPHPYP